MDIVGLDQLIPPIQYKSDVTAASPNGAVSMVRLLFFTGLNMFLIQFWRGLSA